ncbi:MAG: adenylate/guanylate cyclase domain-containing protein, partial [Deltaproteobacteria bacterium]|nr:adenylate/guanylate cyclase domain-containing protein [Deltaproteobacteria bacterium]
MKGRLCPRCGTVNSGESIVCVQCSYHFEGADELERSPSGRREHERAKFLGDKVLAVDKSGVEARKLVTILYGKFFHLASLNHIMDRLEVFRIIEDCFANLTTILEKHGGTVTLVRGEGFQALFGAPMAHEDHFLRACNAALETRAHMRKFGKEVSGPPGELLDVGLGICSDLIVMGTMSQVLGVDPQDVEDPESIGSRIRDLVRPGLVLVDRKACKLAEDYFDFQTLETGRSDAAAEEFYELLGARLAETRIQAQVAKGLTRFVGR